MMNRNWPVVFAFRARKVLPPNRSPPPSASTYAPGVSGSCLLVTRTAAPAGAAAGASWKSPAAAARASAAAGTSCGDVRRNLRSVLPLAHRGERRAYPMVHRKERQLSAVGLHRPAVRRPGRQVGKVAAHHRPAVGRQLELDFAAHHEHGSVAAQMRVPRHRRAGVAGEGGELVHVAGVLSTRDALHDLAADAVILAGVVRQHVHALLARQLSHHRLGVRAAHLDGVENLVRYAGKRIAARAGHSSRRRSIRPVRCRQRQPPC